MKNLQTTLVAVVAAAVLSIVLPASADTGVQAGYGTVVRVEGIATYSMGDGKIHPLIPGKTLPAGATIYTGENGSVDVVLGKEIDFPQALKAPDRISPAPDAAVRGYIGFTPSAEQNVVRLNPDTTLTIDKLTTSDTGADTVSDTELNLQKGRIFASVKKMSPTSEYLVKIPNGVAGIRGTKCSIGADGLVAVFESTSSGVVVSLTQTSANGTSSTQTFLVAPGQVFDPAGNGVVAIPPSELHILQGIFAQVQTGYYVSATVTVNHGTVHISATSGNTGSTTTSGTGPL